MASPIDASDIRRFVDRDWELVARSKLDRWIARKRDHGLADSLRVADDLRRRSLAHRR